MSDFQKKISNFFDSLMNLWEDDDPKEEYALGQEWGEANEKEAARKKAIADAKSPLKGITYADFDSGSPIRNPKETELDQAIIELIGQYKMGGDKAREALRNSLTQEDLYTLMSFCWRATVFGLRGVNDHILSALIALAMIDKERCDFRDVIVALGFVNHGLNKIEVAVDALYEEAIQLAAPPMGELIRGFHQKNPSAKSIEKISGYTPYDYEEGIGFIRYGYATRMSKLNLPAIAFAIGKHIETDKYGHVDITVGENMPPIWVGGDKDEHIQAALNKAMTTVSLHAYSREEFVEDWLSQMFLLYLVEFKQTEEANSLMKMIGREKFDKAARVFGVVDKVFYILIQRSTKMGEKDFETYESLQRFRGPIELLIDIKK